MTRKLRTSPDRGKFSIEKAKERDAHEYAEYLERHFDNRRQQETDPSWQQNNLEYDLRTSDWLAKKVRNSERYAQHLYAALCNNEFQKLSVIEILKDQTWSCSWRYAGGIIADIREQGDYLDWYCSGRLFHNYDESARIDVAEGDITDEIRQDLNNLGWRPVENHED